MKKKLILLPGSSNSKLFSNISTHLEIPLTDPRLIRFANGEICCEIESNVRGADIFVLQTFFPPVNDYVMELFIMIDALKRASAKTINVVMPHFPYSRQDRKPKPRTPITAKLIADLLTSVGATRVTTMDIHAPQLQGFFNIPFDNIYASPIFLNYIQEKIELSNLIIVSPDSGGIERGRHYAKNLKTEIAMIDKRRTGKNISKAMNIIGDVKDKNCIIVDDMIDTGGTLSEACLALKSHGARDIYAISTHAVFSGPAISNINDCESLKQVIVTDTIPLSEEAQNNSKIKCLSCSKLISEAIFRTYNNESVSSLFSPL